MEGSPTYVCMNEQGQSHPAAGAGVTKDTHGMGNESIVWPDLELPKNLPWLLKDYGEDSLAVVVLTAQHTVRSWESQDTFQQVRKGRG